LPENSWNEQVRALVDIAQAAKESLRLLGPMVESEVAADVLPREEPEPASSLYRTLMHELNELEQLGREIFERLSAQPAARLLGGYRLSAEQFYALRCSGIELPRAVDFGLACWDEYELYLLMHYEDDLRVGWINPTIPQKNSALAETARETTVTRRFGIAPEAVRVSALRPEQIDFFKSHMPDTFARFQPG
jgi:hypothetical protein